MKPLENPVWQSKCLTLIVPLAENGVSLTIVLFEEFLLKNYFLQLSC